jgi:flagella basal body P-ring formation protein FlgA
LNTDVDIEFITTVRTTEFDDDKIDAEIVFTSDILPGINTTAVKFSNSERILKYNELNVRIKLLQDVWVASESIPVNSIISEKNLVLEKKYLQNSELPLDISQLIGRETSRSIKKGEIITKNQLADEVLIKRGEKVILIVHSGNVKVRCTGTAVQDGISGQQIRVKRDMSQAVISGKVADDGTVMIFSNTFTSK